VIRWQEARADLIAGFGLLTRLPMPRGIQGSPLGRSIWVWPLVGLVVGAIGAGVYAVALHCHLWPLIGALLAVLAMTAITGALHEDGLADTADGIGGGAAPERRLAIMKDSRIGSFGALALIGSVGLRVFTITQIAEPRVVAAILVTAAVLGRAAMPGVLLLSAAARAEGLAASLGTPDRARIGAGWLIAALLCLLLVTPHHALAAVIGAVVVVFGMAALGRRMVGGYTGDTLGATEQLTECVVLLVLVAMVF
jgi:adenosylcobinamide-GDP ribazoletransferase